MTAIVLPAPSRVELPRIVLPSYEQLGERLRLPRWARPWERTKEDALVEAVTLDQALGTGTSHASATISLVTSAVVASGATVILICGRFNSVTTNTMSVTTAGGLTWTQDVISAAAQNRIAIFRALAPSGLASGTTLTVTHAGSSPASTDSLIGGGSLLGVDTVSPFVNSGSGGGTGTGWSSGNVAASSSNALVGGAFCDGLTGSSTPTSPGVELFDINDATQTETETGVYKLSVAGTDVIDGTWSGSVTWAAAAVAYKAAAAAGGSSPRIIVSREAQRRASRW